MPSFQTETEVTQFPQESPDSRGAVAVPGVAVIFAAFDLSGWKLAIPHKLPQYLHLSSLAHW